MKYRLLAPGPTQVPDRVLKEMSRTIIHHRTEQFERVFQSCQKGLGWLLNSQRAPLILASSGTGGFEASLQNFFRRDDKIICIGGGKFANNWYKMSQVFGLNAIEVSVEWGSSVDLNVLQKVLDENPDAKGVILVASETSTGVMQPFAEIGQMVKKLDDCLFVVDGVTAVGVLDIEPERDDIDVLIAGGQKGLMIPPGLSFVWANDRSFARCANSDLPKFYFDLVKEKKAQAKSQTAYTPAVSLIMGLCEALAIMQEEGRQKIFDRHLRLSKACQKGAEALGLTLFAKVKSPAITSIVSPPELPENAVYQGLVRHANITIAGGQEHLKGKIFRIGHMGYVDDIDLISVFGALEIVLHKLGHTQFDFGDSLKAMAPIIEEGF